MDGTRGGGQCNPANELRHELEPKNPKSRWYRRRIVRCILWSSLGFLLPVIGYSGLLKYQVWQIESLGGTVKSWHSPLQQDLQSGRYSQLAKFVSKSAVAECLFQQFPSVHSIDFRNVDQPQAVTSMLKIAANCPRLRDLILYRSAVNDQHLATLAQGFQHLHRLSLNETKITDTGIQHLRNLPRLQQLNLQRTNITNKSIPDLAAIPRLKELSVGETGITNIQPILNAHPGCWVNREIVTRKKTTDYYKTHSR